MNRYIVLVILMLISIGLCCIGSELYPPNTDYSFDGLASWSQPRIIASTSLPVGTASDSDLWFLLSDSNPVLYRYTELATTTPGWKQIGGSVGGSVFAPMSGSSTQLFDVATPTAPTHAVNKGYFDTNAGTPLIAANNQTATYTLVLSDAGKLVRMSTASTTVGLQQSILIPPVASVAWPIGTVVNFCRAGVGDVRVAGAISSVTINSAVNTATTPWLYQQFSGASAIYLGTDTWDVFGHIKAGN